jgi:hypothetical protein
MVEIRLPLVARTSQLQKANEPVSAEA